jgi:hypothetical protein
MNKEIGKPVQFQAAEGRALEAQRSPSLCKQVAKNFKRIGKVKTFTPAMNVWNR